MRFLVFILLIITTLATTEASDEVLEAASNLLKALQSYNDKQTSKIKNVVKDSFPPFPPYTNTITAPEKYLSKDTVTDTSKDNFVAQLENIKNDASIDTKSIEIDTKSIEFDKKSIKNDAKRKLTASLVESLNELFKLI